MDAPTFTNAPLRWKAAILLSGAFVVTSLCLWGVMGNTGAYFSLLFGLPALFLSLSLSSLATVMKNRWVWTILAGFFLVVVAFLLQPGQESLTSIADFAFFALVPLLATAAIPFARRVSVNTVSWIFFSAAVLCAWVGISGLTAGNDRVSAPELSPIHFADLALICGFAALSSTLKVHSYRTYILYAAPTLGLLAAIASGTRSSMLVALSLAVVFAMFWLRTRKWSLGRQVLLLVGVLVMTLAAFFFAHALGLSRPFSALEPIFAVLKGELPADTSAMYRVEMYRSAVAAFWDAPLFGHGWHKQLEAAFPYLSETAQAGYAAEAWGYIHSDFLSFAVSAGVLGVTAYCLFIAAPVIAAMDAAPGFDAAPRLYLAVTASVGLFVSGLTDVLFMVEAPKLILIVVCAVVSSAPSRPRPVQ